MALKSKRKTLIIWLACGLAVVLALAITWTVTGNRVVDPQPGQTEVAQSNETTFGTSNATLIENGTNSRSKDGQATTVVPLLRKGEWLADQSLPDGATMTIDRQSFKIIKQGRATVRANISGSVNAQFTVGLAYVQDETKWLVYTMEGA